MIMIRLLILLTCLCSVWGEELCCPEIEGLCFTDDPPFDHLPLPTCPDEVQVSMVLYTRSNRDEGQVITRTTIPPAWQQGKRTHLIVHGWLGSGNNRWQDEMKDAALDRGDYNMVIVGWQESSQQLWYPQSASDTRSVGAHIASVLANLVDHGGADPANFYCTGHSLGSHVCGHSGAYSQSLYGFIMGRITGMDPAGPLFESTDWEVGLNPSCASFVDVIHTHGEPNIILNLGTMKVLGHVDFYPNGGGTQPGCILDPFQHDEGSEETDLDLTPACSHLRAVTYYTDSIAQSCFHSRYLCTDQYDLPGSCEQHPDPIQTMGFSSDEPGYMTSGIFYLETYDSEPFCQN